MHHNLHYLLCSVYMLLMSVSRALECELFEGSDYVSFIPVLPASHGACNTISVQNGGWVDSSWMGGWWLDEQSR